ncbi:MAG: hemagglutinin repeat-containing protein, partial [Gammaproteobacteria bacterium]|nr:filamentous hemagglutinin N-terminal domain-containing protein [Rhodocyclaceae bacterium]MBU3909809.1 hemagglutinin repeat-containing protein [Gammaproteobacteria bacterium]MBU3988659.1 hemagglutinin repeat-containing protein [Gammaproteobacteria bacterium]MBU4003919.1 hemagglutinin repeat-containing protein [Gammaproteobacteria bacterium]MBU4097825.1 hemagglutinin repeat-containing protein [Gammaproteobacteria bacterium]
MNANRYRIVFNPSRGQFMPVAETATSHGKAPGATPGSASAPKWVSVRALTLALCSAFGLVMWPAPGQAQIVADPGALGNQRPTIFNAPNGVPLVNIQTPSAAGVSRNTYSQFDVQQQGAILNNARSNAQTQLGGWVQGNPWLAAGSARVILNEVNASNPSLLHGYVEVAGQRAQVVIANPAGVTCDGCGFINASRATLTTGTPTINGGSLDGYVVQRGQIAVQGAGLDASQADYTDLIARSVAINAGVWAKDLKVITGPNQVGADNTSVALGTGSGGAPAFAIDVAQLGGMYAGKITLIGTEAGVGVKNAGHIGASVGAVIVTAAGRLENAGLIISAGNIQIVTAGLDNPGGQVQAAGDVTINTGGAIDNRAGLIAALQNLQISDPNAATPASKTLAIANTDGVLIAGQSLVVDSSSLSGDGQVLSLGDLQIKLNTDFSNASEVIANRNASISTTGDLVNSALLQAGNSLHVTTANIDNTVNGEISATGTTLVAGNTLRNRGLIDGGQTLVQGDTVNNLGTGRIYGDTLAIAATTLTNTAENGVAPVIAARDRLDIGAQTIDNRERALIFSAGDLSIGGAIDANRQASGQVGTLNNASATIEALGNLNIAATRLNNSNEHFSTQVVAVGVAQSFTEYTLSGGDVYRGIDLVTRHAASAIRLFDCEATCATVIATGDTSDAFTRYDFTRAITETQVQSSDPAQILAGGAMHIDADHLRNDNSHIIAGGALSGAIGTLDNTAVAGERTITDAGSATAFWRQRRSGRDTTTYSTAAYTPAPVIQAIDLTPTVYQQNTAPSGSGTQLGALTTGNVSHAVLPNNSLFGLSANPNASYLIETDPRFASYRNWLSSDYLLNALSIDPAATQKRLGDGFYEQKLIREQVAQLTGRRFLDGYASDEAQYQALLAGALTYAQAHQLDPGIALTATQMAALTSDIVWLVEKTINLPNGQTTQALVPQLYVRVREGDISAAAGLLAGNSVNLDLTGDLSNSGTIAGRTLLSLTAENVKNLGGRISGNDVAVAARTDLDNIGGTIDAANSLTALAGRDLNLVSTTRTQTNAQGSRSNLDRVAGLYVSGGAGMLVAAAGRDLNLTAASIINTASAGSTTLVAGNNLNLDTVTDASSNRIVWDGNNYRKDSSRSDIGTVMQTQGDILLQAGNDLNAKAASIASDRGVLHAAAGNNLNLTAGEANRSLDEAHQHTSKGFLSSKTVTTRDNLAETRALGTTLSGDSVSVEAGRDIHVSGSNVVSTQGTSLAAGQNITIAAATHTSAETHFREQKKSGIFSSGGIGITLGTQQHSTDQQGVTTTAAAATLGSTHGDVNIRAGQSYTQTGSDLLAPQGDIAIAAQQIAIQEARENSRQQTESKFKQSGLTLDITSPVISAIQTVQQMGQAAGNTSDGRMQALAGASAGLAAKSGYDAIQAGQGITAPDGTANQMPIKNDQGDITGYRDATAAEQVGGINLAISIGGSKSQSNSVQTSDTARGSTVAAGRDISLTASGAGMASDLTIQGSQISAGRDLTLQADHAIQLLAARNTAEQHSSNKNSSGSIGISVGTAGFGVTVAAGAGRGNADGNDLTHLITKVGAGGTAQLSSGQDTTLQGAVVSGQQVVATVGGNLNIESLQDTSQYQSKQQSRGGSITVGASVSGSASASKSKIDSSYASVTEQAGIKAGDGGFQVNVQGNTDLKGGVITSTQSALDQERSSFQTGGTLTTSDIHNQASYDARAAGVTLGAGVSLDGKLAPQGSSAGIGK